MDRMEAQVQVVAMCRCSNEQLEAGSTCDHPECPGKARIHHVCETCGHQSIDLLVPQHCEECESQCFESFTVAEFEAGEADAFSDNAIDQRVGCFA